MKLKVSIDADDTTGVLLLLFLAGAVVVWMAIKSRKTVGSGSTYELVGGGHQADGRLQGLAGPHVIQRDEATGRIVSMVPVQRG